MREKERMREKETVNLGTRGCDRWYVLWREEWSEKKIKEDREN
jgi:hypothetical protein